MRKKCKLCESDLVAKTEIEKQFIIQKHNKKHIVKNIDFWYCPSCRIMYHYDESRNRNHIEEVRKKRVSELKQSFKEQDKRLRAWVHDAAERAGRI